MLSSRLRARPLLVVLLLALPSCGVWAKGADGRDAAKVPPGGKGAVVDPDAAVLAASLPALAAESKAPLGDRRVHKLGLLPSGTKPGLYRGGDPAATGVRPADALPASADLTANLPAIGDQGSQGSCAGWAIGYYGKTLQEKREHGWDLQSTRHLFSPSFLYNQRAPFDEGLTFDEVMNLVLDEGVATLHDCPYDETDHTSWPTYEAFLNGIPQRSASYTRLGDRLTPGLIDAMKTRLASGDPCFVGIPIYRPSPSAAGRFDLLDAGDHDYRQPGQADVYNAGGHALCVVGYDDSLSGGQGGFTIANSWGTSWGDGGFAHLSYEFILAYAFDVYQMEDRIGYTPRATVRYAFSHTFWGWNYDNVTLTMGVGSTATPAWSKVMITELEQTTLAVDMAWDLTDALAYLPPDWTNRWWFRMDDSSREDQGKLTRLEITVDGTVYGGNEPLPLWGPFYSGSMYAYVPAGEKAADQYYVNDASLVGDQYCSATGSDANDGLSPATPKATVQAIVDRYTLKAGDVVWVDAGQYDLAADITVTQADQGADGDPVRFVGALGVNGEPVTSFTRAGTTGACWTLTSGGQYVQIENMALAGGQYGVQTNTGSIYYLKGFSAQNIRCLAQPLTFLEFSDVRLSGSVLRSVVLSRSTGRLSRCDIVTPSGGYGVGLYSSSSDYASNAYGYLDHCILSATGSGGRCVSLGSYAVVSSARYNALSVTGGATIGFAPDSSNITVDPLFANAAGGDYHLQSPAGRWDPAANGGLGGWVITDTQVSPCIDAGDPAQPVGAEPAPNGGRLNVGAYAGAAFASKSGSPRWVRITSPNGGETWKGTHDVTWSTWGAGWAAGDTVTLEYWDGAAWNLLNAGADAVPHEAGARQWNANGPGIVPGAGFKVRARANADAAYQDESDAVFTVDTAPTLYYVNDSDLSGDVYCSAAGDDLNDGLTPATPKATVQAILDTHDLGPGDTVYVDTGYYTLAADITVASGDVGNAGNYMWLVGSTTPGGTVLDRASATANARCINLGTSGYVGVRDFDLTGATAGSGIYAGQSGYPYVLEWLRAYGSKTGIEVAGTATIRHCLCYGNSTTGLSTGSYGCTIAENTCWGNGTGVSWQAGTCTGNILCADGASGRCMAFPMSVTATSDHNLFWPTGGATAVYDNGTSTSPQIC